MQNDENDEVVLDDELVEIDVLDELEIANIVCDDEDEYVDNDEYYNPVEVTIYEEVDEDDLLECDDDDDEIVDDTHMIDELQVEVILLLIGFVHIDIDDEALLYLIRDILESNDSNEL